MHNIPLKKYNIPLLGIGTWQIGGRAEADYSNDDAAVAGLNRALDAGFTHIDTAEMYGGGHAEELVAQALSGRRRSDCFITDKVWKDHLSYDGVMLAVEKSLQRLKTDYLDLYLVHQTAPDVDWAGVARAFRKLYNDKVLRNLGVSNFSVERWRTFEALAGVPLAVNQVHYNLACREAEVSGVIDYAQKFDKMVIAWRPLQKGALDLSLPIVTELAAKYGKTPTQVALNYLLSQPNVAAVAKMQSVNHIKENLGAVGWAMDDADLVRLKEDYPGQYFTSEAVPLS